MRKIKISKCGDVLEILGEEGFYELFCPLASDKGNSCCSNRCAGFYIWRGAACCAFMPAEMPIGELVGEQQDNMDRASTL